MNVNMPVHAARAELARRRLASFCARVVPQYKPARHSDFMCDVFQRALSGTGKRKIALNAPPGHGKSTTTQAFVAYALGIVPHARVIALSASAKLAEHNSRMIKAFIESAGYPFPGVGISTAKDSLMDWSTTAQSPGQSSFKAFGADSAVTGHRGDILMVDDIQPDEMTTDTRDTLEARFRGVMTTRVDPEPLGMTIVIATRWGPDDLIARLRQGDDRDQWEFINLEAICECGPDDDPLSRGYGAELWPEVWPADRLEKIKQSIGSANWATQYQGHPVPAGGRIFNDAWFSKRYSMLPAPPSAPDLVAQPTAPALLGRLTPHRDSLSLASPSFTITALDAAQKENIGGSYSALCTVAVFDGKIYVVQSERERAPFDRLLKMTDAHCLRHKSTHLIAEDAAMGSAVISTMKGQRPFTVVPVKPTAPKEERAMQIVPICERGEVVFPAQAGWLGDFEVEIRDFPGGRNNDQVDAFVWAVIYARQLLTRELDNRRIVSTFAQWQQR